MPPGRLITSIVAGLVALAAIACAPAAPAQPAAPAPAAPAAVAKPAVQPAKPAAQPAQPAKPVEQPAKPAAAAKPAQVYEWRQNVQWGAADIKTRFVKEFGDLVTERSKGAIKITQYPDSSLLKADDAAKQTSRGAVPIDATAWFSYEKFVSFLRVVSVPFLGLNATDLRQLVRPGTQGRKIVDEAFAQHNIKLLAVWEGGPLGLVTFDPLNTPESLKGAKLRISGAIASAALRAAGAQIVVMGGAEAVDAMRKRIVVGSTIEPTGIKSRGYHDFAKYWVDWRLFPNPASMQINLGVWNQLPKELQDIVWTTAQEIEEKADRAVIQAQEAALDEVVSKHGMSLAKVAPSDQAKLRATSRQAVDAAVAELEPKDSVREFLKLMEGAAPK